MAEQNTENAVSLIQTAEGGLDEPHAILQRMRELAVQSSNGTYTQEDRDQITLEYEALKSEITRIAQSTHYNGIHLLNGNLTDGYAAASGATANVYGISGTSDFDADKHAGNFVINTTVVNKTANTFTGTVAYTGDGTETSYDVTGAYDAVSDTWKLTIDDGTDNAIEMTMAGSYAAGNALSFSIDDGEHLTFQIGANGSADQRVNLNVDDMSAEVLNIVDSHVYSVAEANDAIDTLDAAINQVFSQRANLGALQNRLERTLNSLGVARENLTAAESTIRDTDMAKEMMKFTQNSILVQASQAMLAQANALPQGILSLLS